MPYHGRKSKPDAYASVLGIGQSEQTDVCFSSTLQGLLSRRASRPELALEELLLAAGVGLGASTGATYTCATPRDLQQPVVVLGSRILEASVSSHQIQGR